MGQEIAPKKGVSRNDSKKGSIVPGGQYWADIERDCFD
jgi:hypothetical protein